MNKRWTIFIFLWFAYSGAGAQRPYMNWYFGNYAGIAFQNSPPADLNGKLFNSEGCASVSNAAGKLLFYTDGIEVYNRNHLPMINGSGLNGHQSSTQSALIVPKPGNSLAYYIFTSDANFGSNGICYSLVEFANATDEGRVSWKNFQVYAPASEKLTAVQHANGKDFWILTHEAGNNVYRCYLLDSNGLNIMNPVRSPVGTQMNISWNNADAVGTLKASSDGKKLVAAVLGKAIFEVYDFDPATGVVSNAVTLADAVRFNNAYSAEFSPDGRSVYFSCTAADRIYQTLVYPDAVRMFQYLISIPLLSPFGPGALQTGPDGRLYIARASSPFISMINYPNGMYPLSQFLDTGVWLFGRQSFLGLPNDFNYSFENSFIWQSNCMNDTVLFTGKAKNYDSLQWNFNDVASGNHNTSTSLSVYHAFSSPGLYRVSFIIFHNGWADTVEKEVKLFKHRPLALPPDSVYCQDSVVMLSAFDSSYVSYKWHDLSTGSFMYARQSGLYKVQTSDGICTYEDSTFIKFRSPPAFSLGRDTVICPSFQIRLSAPADQQHYRWQDNSNDSFLIVKWPGEYFVSVKNECGVHADTMLIEDCTCIPLMPTAFSPNQNGHNDLLKAEGCDPFAFEMFIYNRWGELVFKTTSIDEGWDGMYQGKPAPEGVYAWLIRYTQTTRVKKANRMLSGSVLLLR